MKPDEIEIGGRVLTFPAEVNAGVLEDCEEDIKRVLKIDGMPLGAEARAIVNLSHRVLSERYPELTLEQVRKGLGPTGLFHVTRAIVRGLGFDVREAKGAAAGEAVSPSSST